MRMTSRIESIAIDTHDSRLLADFWTQALGWEVVDVDGPLIEIGPADGSGPTIDLLAVPETKTVKNRLHLDLVAEGCTTAEEIARLEALGATRVDVGQDPSVTWTVLADPEGNEFCVLGRAWSEAHRAEG